MTDEKKDKATNKIAKVFSVMFWLIGIASIRELLKYNERLNRCSEIVGSKKLKVDNFKKQINRIRIISLLSLLPFVLATINHLQIIFSAGGLGFYWRLLKTIKTGDQTILADFISSNPGPSVSLVVLLLAFIIMHIYLTLFIRNYEISIKTKQLIDLARRLNLVDEDAVANCLWTKVGVLMELKSSTASELVKNSTFWNQLDMEPGEVIYSKKEKKKFFIMSGFELADAYDFTIKD